MALLRGLLLDVHLDASPVEALMWSLAILAIATACSGLLLEARRASRRRPTAVTPGRARGHRSRP